MSARLAATPIVQRLMDRIVLSNSVVARTILLPTAARPTLGTIDFRTVPVRSRYFTGEGGKFEAEADEFGFGANGIAYIGKTGWTLRGIADAAETLDGRGVDIVLGSADGRLRATWAKLPFSAQRQKGKP